MADNLSLDLCREILLHLPVKSLIRFTAVSKSWRSLITSRDFIYAHLSNSKTQTLLFNGYGSVHVLAASTGVRPCYEPRFPNVPRLKNSRVVGSSGGLVCLSATNLFIREYNSIVIWNPSVGHHVFLKQPITITERAHPPTLGFGVAGHVYKIVRIVHGHDPVVYTLGTGRWRSVEGFEFADRSEIIGPQTLLKGVLHWLYCEPGRKNSCLTFEIGDEVFSKVMLPDVLGREEEVSLSSIEGSLAVVAVKYSHYVSDDIHVWVMKESWIKLCSIDLGNLGKGLNGEVLLIKREGRVVGFRNGEAIIAFAGMNLVGYNLKTGKAKDLGISGFYSLFYIDDYVESLLVPAVLKNDSRTSLSDPFFLFA